MTSTGLTRCAPYCPVSIVVVHDGSLHDTAETTWHAVTAAVENPAWDAELVLVSDDEAALSVLAAPFSGNVVTARSLSAVVVRGVVIEVLSSGDRLDVTSVSKQLLGLHEGRADVQLAMVLVCDDDAEAVTASVLSFLAAAEQLPIDPALVLVSRAGAAAETVWPAVSGDSVLVSCHPMTDDIGAFATGLNRSARYPSVALVLAGEAVDVGTLATLALSGGHSRAGTDAEVAAGPSHEAAAPTP